MQSTASHALTSGDRTAPSVADMQRTVAERFDAEAMPHVSALFRTAQRMLGDRSRAEDVTQEVLLQAWKCFSRYEAGTNCKAWLFKILFHCVQHQRRQWFRFPVLKEPSELAETGVEAMQLLPEHLTDAEILAALERLPEEFRAVALLVDVEELSYKEAAEALAIPIGTVMSRLNRARLRLRTELGKVALSYGIGAAPSPAEAVDRERKRA